jgi:hypothetical protein
MTDTQLVIAIFLTFLPITVLLVDAEINNICQYFERIVNRGIQSIERSISVIERELREANQQRQLMERNIAVLADRPQK